MPHYVVRQEVHYYTFFLIEANQESDALAFVEQQQQEEDRLVPYDTRWKDDDDEELCLYSMSPFQIAALLRSNPPIHRVPNMGREVVQDDDDGDK